MKQLRQVSIIGLGLLGASVSLAALRAYSGLTTIGYSHRPSTRKNAKKAGIATTVTENIHDCVKNADLVILASPVRTFENIFAEIADSLPPNCIVTDVGSTKTLPHKWAAKLLGKKARYVGSHPIAGSEKRGFEFARDDLLSGARCIITKLKTTDPEAINILKKFWTDLGCRIDIMTPSQHDKIFANVSHVPHITAAALINASKPDQLEYAGKGFMDTSRIASGPPNIWTDIFMTNNVNTAKGIDKVITELQKLKKAIENKDAKKIEALLEQARSRRSELIKYKMKKKEILS